MLTKEELKERLQTCARNGFLPSGSDEVSELVPSMLEQIGSTDSELRDELIYSAFGRWILRHNALSPEQLRDLLPIVLDERHMLYRLGEQDTDSVFRRAFSVLILPLLLIAHRKQPLFSAPEIHEIKERLLYFMKHEQDRRGFVPEKGWAHAIAHAADALDDLAQCTEMTSSDLGEILTTVREAACFERAGYSHLEDERLVTAVLAVLRTGRLSEAEICRWIEGFPDLTRSVTSGPQKHVLRGNSKNFLQSLYFRLQWEGMANGFEVSIDQALRRINPFAPQSGT